MAWLLVFHTMVAGWPGPATVTTILPGIADQAECERLKEVLRQRRAQCVEYRITK